MFLYLTENKIVANLLEDFVHVWKFQKEGIFIQKQL